jgi:hypothetical protein
MGGLRPKLRLRMLLQEPLRNLCQGRRGLLGIALCGRIAAGYDHSCQPLGLGPRRLWRPRRAVPPDCVPTLATARRAVVEHMRDRWASLTASLEARHGSLAGIPNHLT